MSEPKRIQWNWPTPHGQGGKAIRPDDRTAWHANIDIVRRGLTTFMEVAHAIMEIREHELWRMEYKNFDAFAEVELRMGRRRANQIEAAGRLLIEFQNALAEKKQAEHDEATADVRKDQAAARAERAAMPEPEGPAAPENERQMRSLNRVKNLVEQMEVWKEGVKAAGYKQPTAESLDEIIDIRQGKYPVDGNTVRIEKAALRPIFETRMILVEAANSLALLATALRGLVGAPGGELIVQEATIGRIAAARKAIMEATPHVACLDCEGVRSGTCERCEGRGWLVKGEE